MRPPSSPDPRGSERPAVDTVRTVDIVGLAGGLLAGAVALSGCGALPEEVRAKAAASKAHVLDVSRDVLGRLPVLGTFKEPTLGDWTGCGDVGGMVLYHVTGRLDPGPGVEGRLADGVVAALAATGLRLRPVDPGADDPVTLEAVRDDVNVQLSGYRSEPFVLVDISGPCLDVGDLDGELLDEAGETLRFG